VIEAAGPNNRLRRPEENSVVGPSYDGVELHPAERRVIGGSEHHPYVAANPMYRLVFGFTVGPEPLFAPGAPR
jgi:hypothetical protein